MSNEQKNTSILIVDDSANNLRLLEDILAPANYKLYFSTEGSHALEIAEQKKPDIILLDILMPGLNGYEVCQKLKDNLVTRHIPVVFISALHSTQEKVKALEVGGVDFITKPFDPAEVKARISSHMNKAKTLIKFDSLLKQTYHELNTPLCIIDTAISLQKKSSGESKYLDNIHAASKTLHHIYKDLYFFMQERQYKRITSTQSIDLFSLVQERLRYFSIIAKTNKIEVNLHGQDDSPEIFMRDLELERLLDNLISNAIYHAQEQTAIQITTSKHLDKLLSINNTVKTSKSESNFQPSISGLGLEIVNTICKDNNLNLHFHIDEDQAHTRLAYIGEKI